MAHSLAGGQECNLNVSVFPVLEPPFFSPSSSSSSAWQLDAPQSEPGATETQPSVRLSFSAGRDS